MTLVIEGTKCTHRWRIDECHGVPKLGGTCTKCGERREEYWWAYQRFLEGVTLQGQGLKHGIIRTYIAGCRCEKCEVEARKIREKGAATNRKRGEFKRAMKKWGLT